MKHLFYLLIILFGSCQQRSSSTETLITPQPVVFNEVSASFTIDTTEAKAWLAKLIVDYFHSPTIDMQEITTAAYYAFKQDAMNVGLELEDSLSEEDFKQKWNDNHDLNTHPIHSGFLIPTQDWGTITVASLHVKRLDTINNSITFRTFIRDTEFQADYDRDIVVVRPQDKYLIADVLEYD